MTDGFALFKDDVRISKVHSTRLAAIIEAFEHGVVLAWSKYVTLARGYAVRPVHHD